MRGEMQMFSIRDEVAQEYGPPFVAKNASVAVRMYCAMIEKEGLVLSTKDYGLYSLGKYDSETGMIHPVKPQLIEIPLEIIKKYFPGVKEQ